MLRQMNGMYLKFQETFSIRKIRIKKLGSRFLILSKKLLKVGVNLYFCVEYRDLCDLLLFFHWFFFGYYKAI